MGVPYPRSVPARSNRACLKLTRLMEEAGLA